MEVDFDKEIDAILRSARRDSPAIPASRHLDADEISAFAENAMPEKSRSLYAAHMADCDRCRKILSSVLVLNSEAVPVAAASPSVITLAERSVPWYRSLFLFPNLAYVMGGLVMILGGFLAFSVIQNSREPMTAAVSEQRDMPATGGEGGPRFDANELESLNSSSSNAMANVAVANTAPVTATSNANANTAIAVPPGGPRAPDNNFAADGITVDTTSPAAAPRPADLAASAEAPTATKAPPAREDAAMSRSNLEEKDKPTEPVVRDAAKNQALLKQQAGQNVQSGPMNRNDRQYNRQLENMDSANAKRAQRSATDGDAAGGRKVVSGRTFERKQGVWYDTSYQGHPTINVRRGSAEFNRLDAGLRTIANSMSGTIVVVWGAKAYRIQ